MSKKTNDVRFNLVISKELFEQLRKEAFDTQTLSLSAVVRDILENYFKNK